MDFGPEVLELVERRLVELGVEWSILTPDELQSRFDRGEVSGPAYHVEIKLDSVSCALTITVLDQEQVDEYAPVRAVSDEVSRLDTSRRYVAYHQVIVAP